MVIVDNILAFKACLSLFQSLDYYCICLISMEKLAKTVSPFLSYCIANYSFHVISFDTYLGKSVYWSVVLSVY